MELVYIVVFFLISGLQSAAVKWNTPRHWFRALIANSLALVGALAALYIFNSLPGKGMTPGLTWFAETLYSMGAAALYGIQFIITVVLYIIKRK